MKKCARGHDLEVPYILASQKNRILLASLLLLLGAGSRELGASKRENQELSLFTKWSLTSTHLKD
jgi:hypothetical protein